eukprot:GFYU01010246.1.p1 GENE.GFYU01010246.1~~GFYU01010246.1.p1  ORF type:complete len:508 (+),score=103.18 GFYU01010246.1:147-1670(+)
MALSEKRVKASVVGSEKSDDHKHTVFAVDVEQGASEWVVHRRYSSFHSLNSRLKKAFPAKKFPTFPPKVFKILINESQLAERRKQLQDYMSEILEDPEIADSSDMKEFLQLDLEKDDAVVVCCGLGRHDGRLGLKEFENHSSFRTVRALVGKSIAHVAAGSKFSMALTGGGELLSWGGNEYGVLGHGDEINVELPKPNRFLKNKEISNIYAGETMAAALTEEGVLYVWGRNADGQLGLGDTLDRHTPTMMAWEHDTLTTISIGGAHCLALTSTGNVAAWGRGLNGRTGLGADNNELKPALIDMGGVKFSAISAGFEHSAAISEAMELYTWGRGTEGQLGHDDKADVFIPKVVQCFDGMSVAQVSLGGMHSAAIVDGKVYCWGAGTEGQLGVEPRVEAQTQPSVVTTLSECTAHSVVCGSQFTYCVTDEGVVYSWGDGHGGCLGQGGDAESVTTPTQVESLQGYAVKEITAGWWHVIALTAKVNFDQVALDDEPDTEQLVDEDEDETQ